MNEFGYITIFGQTHLYSYLDVLRAVIALITFAVAGYQDFQTHSVKRYVWIPAILFGIISFGFEIIIFNNSLSGFIFPLVFASGIIFLLYSYGSLAEQIPYLPSTGFGLADVFSAVTLVVLFPTLPYLGPFPIYSPIGNLFFFTVFLNAGFVYIVLMGGFITKNILQGDISSRSEFISGAKVKKSQLLTKSAWVPDVNGKTTEEISNILDEYGFESIIEVPKDETFENDTLTAIQELDQSDDVWVIYQIPLVSTLFIGLVSALTLGSAYRAVLIVLF